MSTNYIAPIWRMPENANNTPVDKLSNYSINMANANERITLTDGVDLGINSTVSLWVNFSTNNNSVILADDINASSSGYFLLLNTSTGDTYVRIGPNFGVTPFNTSWNLNQWYNIIIVRQGDTVEFFKDNVSLGTRSGYGTTVTTKFDCIGAKNAGTNPMYGQISQVVGFNYALTDGTTPGTTNQIEYLYNLNNPMVPGDVNLTAPVIYYPLGDNSNPNSNAGYPNTSVGADSVFDFIPHDYIQVADNDLLSFGDGVNDSPFTMSAWIKTTGNGDGIISKWGGSPSGYEWLVYIALDKIRVNLYDANTSTFQQRNGVTIVNTGEWVHVVATYDGRGGTGLDENTANQGIKIYINGVEESSYTNARAGFYVAMHNTIRPVQIGTYNTTSSVGFDGEMTNVQIWKTDLTAPEVSAVYNNGQPLMTGTQPQEANLTAWYKLNQSANWEADTVGNWQIPDAVSSYPQSFNFDGSGDYIDCGKNSTLNINGDLTISAWVNIDAHKNYNGVVSKISGTDRNYEILVRSTGKITFYTQPTGGTIDLTTSTTVIPINTWTNIIVTVDSGVTNGTKFYFNGVQDATTGTHTVTANTANLNIGRRATGGFEMDGLISNVQIFDTALPATGSNSVETLYNNGTPLTTAISSDNLKAWYKLDNTELFDGTNWSVENQKYPANWESSFNSSIATGMLRDNDSKSEYDNQLFSMSVWVKPKSGVATNGDIFSCKGSSNYGVALLYNSNALIFQLGDATTTAVDGGSPANNGNWSFYENRVPGASPTYTEYDQWSHIVVVWNGTNSKFYINGDLVSTITPPSALTVDYSFGNTISAIGGRNDAGSGYFTGNISNFAYWESELDQTAVTALYNNGTPEVTISQSPNHWFTLKDFATGSVDQIGSLNYEDSTPSALEFPDNFVSTEAGVSSGMTEQNLVNNNVSVLNGESVGMNTTNLVQSNLTRTQPYSNYSFNFDAATNDYITISSPGSIFAYGESALTFSGWINVDNFKNQDGIFGRRYSTDLRATIKLSITSPYNGIMFLTQDGSGTLAWKDWPGILTAGQWYHICITYEAGAVKLYLDGVDQGPTGGTGTIANPMPNLNSFNYPLDIALDRQNTSRLLDGRTSNFCVFDRVLTEDEILKIYNNGITQNLQATSSFSNNILAWWPMDENSSYYDGTNWVVRDLEGGKDGDGVNTGNVEDMVGSAPGSEASGTGTNLTIADLKGDMYNSDKNAYSINMADYADGVTNPASSGRSTEVPSV